MQLKISAITCAILATTTLFAEDYVSVQYMSYNEDSGKTTIHTPSIEINKDFGADYTLNISAVHDSVSGASPTYYDASSGASATLPTGHTYTTDVIYGNIPYEEKRKAVSVNFTKRFVSRDEINMGYSYSDEHDYTSHELSAEYLHYLDSSKNSSLSIGTSYQKNDLEIYCFMNTKDCDGVSGASSKVKKRDLNVVNLEIGYTQILNRTSVLKGSIYMIDEDGYLSNPYMRVVINYNSSPTIAQEQKPDTRRAYGVSLEYTKALTQRVSSIISYRFYDDNWDITSHTIDLRTNYEWSNKTTIGIDFRAYTQTKAKFYSDKKIYFTNQKYASSDRRMSDFASFNYSLSLKHRLNSKITANISGGYYKQPNYFNALYFNLGLKYNF